MASKAKKESPRKEHARKSSSFSWEIEGSDFVRRVAFKALKKDNQEKIGFGLGGKGQRREVVMIKNESQAYWRGIIVGYLVTAVNDKEVNDITVASAIKECCAGTKDFTISFQVPNKPDWADKSKGGADDPSKKAPKADKKKEEAKQEDKPISEPAPKPKSSRGKIQKRWSKTNMDEITGGIVEPDVAPENQFVDDDDEDLFAKGAPPKASQASAAPAAVYQEPPKAAVYDLENATKEELQRMEQEKLAEIDKLRKADQNLKDLIRRKEMELKQQASRQVLEELKNLRKQAKGLKDRIRKAMDELDRIREMLRRRLAQLERDMGDLAASSQRRDDALNDLEAQVRALTAKALND